MPSSPAPHARDAPAARSQTSRHEASDSPLSQRRRADVSKRVRFAQPARSVARSTSWLGARRHRGDVERDLPRLRTLGASTPAERHVRRERIGIGAPAGAAPDGDIVVMEPDARGGHRRWRELRARRRDRDLGATQELHAELARLHVRADHAVDAIAIGDRDRSEPHAVRLLHQPPAWLAPRGRRSRPGTRRVAHLGQVFTYREAVNPGAGIPDLDMRAMRLRWIALCPSSWARDAGAATPNR